MTTGLSDQQLIDAFNSAPPAVGAINVRSHVAPGLRAVADLAITHLEAELYGRALRIAELEKLVGQKS